MTNVNNGSRLLILHLRSRGFIFTSLSVISVLRTLHTCETNKNLTASRSYIQQIVMPSTENPQGVMDSLHVSLDSATIDTGVGKRKLRSIEADGSLTYEEEYVSTFRML